MTDVRMSLSAAMATPVDADAPPVVLGVFEKTAELIEGPAALIADSMFAIAGLLSMLSLFYWVFVFTSSD